MRLIKNSGKKLKAISAAFILLLMPGCSAMTTQNPYTGQSQLSDTTKGVGIGTLGVGLAGGLIGGKEGALIGAGVGALGGGLFGHHLDTENAELRQTLVGTGVQVSQTGNSIQLIMPGDITFDTAQSSIKSSFYPTLNSIVLVLKKYQNTSIIISGYTDNVGNDAYNQSLSENRAQSVGNYITAQGISDNRIFTQGFGERNPLASNSITSGRAQNRRVEITLRPFS